MRKADGLAHKFSIISMLHHVSFLMIRSATGKHNHDIECKKTVPIQNLCHFDEICQKK